MYTPVAFLLALPIVGADPKATSPAPVRFPFDADQATTLRAAWADHLRIPAELTNSVGMKLVLVPPGTFEMGPHGSKVRVTLTKPFYTGTTEVTLGQYRKWKPDHTVEGADPEFNADDRPAARVSWKDAGAYCEWLSKQKGEAGRRYAVPTGAQWEWAARAGTASARHFGDTDKGQAEYTWFNVTYTPNPKFESNGRGRQPVGKLRPNPWGLYDTLGNVWEWCADRHADSATGETRDPVMRGGSWRSGASHCTSVAHDPGSPDTKADHIGFRVVFVVD